MACELECWTTGDCVDTSGQGDASRKENMIGERVVNIQSCLRRKKFLTRDLRVMTYQSYLRTSPKFRSSLANGRIGSSLSISL